MQTDELIIRVGYKRAGKNANGMQTLHLNQTIFYVVLSVIGKKIMCFCLKVFYSENYYK